MKNFLKKLKIKIANLFIPEENISASKKRWQSLAEKDAKYIVWTEKEKVSEEDFRNSGKRDYSYVAKEDPTLHKLTCP